MRGKTWAWIVCLAGVGAVAGVYAWRTRPVEVVVVAPTRGPAIDAIYATGTVEPTVMLPIAPRAAGRIVDLNVDEGAAVKKGQVLARLDDSDLASTVEELEARAEYAQSQHERISNLVRQGFMAKAESDRTHAEMDAAIAAVKRARSQRDFMSLMAPADGLVIRRDGERGQFIPAGQAVFVLSCCAPLRVTAEVDEEDIARVKEGQKAVMRADALPGQVFDGTVSEVTPKGDPVSRSYRVRIRIADPSRFRVGMTVDLNLIVAERADALLVPTTAVQDKSAVWLVNDGRLTRQAVRVGTAGSGKTEILGGLGQDARIVASPNPRLEEGRRARVREPEQKK
jgi:RND family efflux transporter MFP subunit